MANKKPTAFTTLAPGSLVDADWLVGVDVSDTTDDAAGSDVKIPGWLTPRTVIKSADQSNSSNTTLADVTDLSFPVVASGVYLIEFTLFVVAAATTTGLVVALNGPTIGAGAIQYAYDTPTSATAEFNAGATAYDTALVSTATISITVPMVARVFGTLHNGATGGTLTLRMRSEISASNATIRKGSWGRLTRMA